jgi:hypothetical protein
MAGYVKMLEVQLAKGAATFAPTRQGLFHESSVGGAPVVG